MFDLRGNKIDNVDFGEVEIDNVYLNENGIEI